MSDISDKLRKIEDEVTAIKLRNKRVERDKAWETSWTRRIFIALTTYIAASLFLYVIGTSNFLVGALVPTFGYLISTFSLTLVRKYWENRQN